MAGQIINRGKRTWLVRIYLGRGANGKRKYKNKTIHGTKDDAQKYLNAKLREKDLGILADAGNQTLNEFLDMWLKTAVKPRVSLRTADNYKFLIEKYVKDAIGDIKLENLSRLGIEKIYADMQEKGLSARSVKHVHTTLKNALKQAVEWEYLQKNVAEYCKIPKVTRKERRVLSPDEANAFLDAASQFKQGLVFEFALLTGMRPEEYLALQWKDIDFERCTAQVRRALVKHKGSWSFEQPKTAKSNRTVSLPKPLVEKLRKHKIKQNTRRLKYGLVWQNYDLVFCGREGNPHDIRNLTYRFFRPILTKAGLPQIRLYDLRHTHATLLLIAEENPKIVAERLGHSTVLLTLDTYSHVIPTMQKQTTEKLEKMLYEKQENNVVQMPKRKTGTQ